MSSRPSAPSNGKPTGDSPKASDHDLTGDLQRARQLLAELRSDKPLLALLSTLSPSGRPHTTWMFASRSTAPGLELLTITSPDSEKVKNIGAHSKVEWLLTSDDRLQQLYLEGEATIVTKVKEIRQLWNMIGDKDRLYFIKYYNSGLGFSIVRTRVVSAIFIAPEDHRKTRFEIDELIA